MSLLSLIGDFLPRTMFRRFSGLAALLAALAVSFLTCAPAAADETIRLRYANFPAPSTFPCVQMEKWADEIEARSGGRVVVETFPGGTLLDARSILRGVVRGQADIGCISMAYHAGSFPFFDVFGLPLGFRSARDAGEAAWAMYLKYRPKELAAYKVLLIFTCSPSQVMSTRPIDKLDDLKGMSLRASGSLSDVLSAVGGQAVSMPMSEAPEALQKGVVQGVFSSWDTLKDYNYAERCRYGLTVDSSVYPFVVVMNRKVWNGLPDDIKAVLDGYALEHCIWTGDYVDGWGRQAVEWSKKTYGFELKDLSEADRARMAEMTAPLLDKWKAHVTGMGMDGQAILDDIFAFQKGQRKP